jgi:hypothetical protein
MSSALRLEIPLDMQRSFLNLAGNGQIDGESKSKEDYLDGYWPVGRRIRSAGDFAFMRSELGEGECSLTFPAARIDKKGRNV